MDFRRRLYRRGSSFETTVPMPLLLALDGQQQHDVIFSFDAERQAWYVRFERRADAPVRHERGRKRGAEGGVR